MATVPFQGVWSSDTQFTGNAVYVIDASGTVWLAADSTSAGAGLYSSPQGATSFSLVTTIPNVSSAALAFDPAIAIDAQGNLHIVGQVLVTGGVVLQKFTYVPQTATLSGPFPITSNGIVGADYDIVALSNGNTYIVSCLLTKSTETIEGFEVTPSGSILNTDFYLTQPFASGSRYGSVSLWTPDGATVEVYFCSEPKAFTFTDTQLSISQTIRLSAGNLSSFTVLATVTARYASGRLTILGNGTERWIVQCMFTQTGASLISNAVLGHLPQASTVWSFQAISGSIADSIIEPVLSISPSTVVLALIDGNVNALAHGGPVKLYDVNPNGWVLTPRTDFPYPAIASFLRGSKSTLPANMPWGFLGQQADTGVARFYTGYNAPPVAQLSPAVEVCQRGVTYALDASGSSDINLDTLQFGWAVNDPTGQAIFTSSGSQATILLPATIGPAAHTVVVTVSVLDVNGQGNPLHPTPSTATATLTYPLIPVPVIGPLDPILAQRNSPVTIAPIITVSPATTPTYLWSQTSGTIVPDLSPVTNPTLTIDTNGSAVAGEVLSFILVVNDGVNLSVSGSFEVVVAARSATGETMVLARSTFSGSIGQRNTVQQWTVPIPSSIITGFNRVKRAPLVREAATDLNGSYILIGPQSVLVQRNGVSYHVLAPNPGDTILDAEHSFLDETLLLTSASELLLMPPNPLNTDTDNATAVIDISDVSALPFTRFTATPPYFGKRVIILTGPSGCLLLSVDADFNLGGSLFLSSNGEHLYGASNVQWARSVGIESLHRGILLIGTQDVAGRSFETEFNLANRTVVSVWDSSKLRNQNVTTGELLFAPVDSYSGYPTPPVLLNPTSTSNWNLGGFGSVYGGAIDVARNADGTISFDLSWTQKRSDLVSGYTVMLALNAGFFPLTRIGSGDITHARITLPPGATYQFQILANSIDGDSLPSNSVSINL